MMQIKSLVRLVLVAGMFASISLADVIQFDWTTSGSFSGAGLPSGLTFTGGSGSASTDASGNLTGMNLGQFSFGNITTSYSGVFTFTIMFTRPEGADNPSYGVSLVAAANLSGVNDQLTINFPAAALYHFGSVNQPPGTFWFGVDDVSDSRTGSHTDTVNLVGNVSSAVLTGNSLNSRLAPDVAAVPEPGALCLFGTVLGAVGLLAKRKKLLS